MDERERRENVKAVFLFWAELRVIICCLTICSSMRTTGFSNFFFFSFFRKHISKSRFFPWGNSGYDSVQTLIHQKQDLHNCSPLHLTLLEVPICGLPKIWLQFILSLKRAVITDWPYKSAACWFHHYHPLFRSKHTKTKVFLGTQILRADRNTPLFVCTPENSYTYTHAQTHYGKNVAIFIDSFQTCPV